MWVKICANTNLEDAAYAIDAGADAVGFVFAPSKRQVTAEQVRAITDHLPAGVERVGVFAAETVEEIAAAVEAAGLNSVQLHGGFNLHAAERLRRRVGDRVSLIHVLHWAVGEHDASLQTVRAQLQELANSGLHERVLIDAKVGKASGGLGVPFNWSRARPLLSQFLKLRVIVAGGLRADNVSEAAETLTPYGVDVASGVELSVGRKDHAKVKAFIEKARRA